MYVLFSKSILPPAAHHRPPPDYQQKIIRPKVRTVQWVVGRKAVSEEGFLSWFMFSVAALLTVCPGRPAWGQVSQGRDHSYQAV